MRFPHLLIPMDGASIASFPCIKFLCSHGGKILPRPADGQLKYVGGETRVISVAKDISFQHLMQKLSYLNNGEMILKYQVLSEELDALVSVKCDEDVGHMVDEISYLEKSRQMLRAFLFPTNPMVMEKQIMDPVAMEQRYVDAVNGIIRCTPTPTRTPTPTPTNSFSRPYPSPIPNMINSVRRHASTASFTSSPRSPESCTTTEATNNCHTTCRMIKMHKVKSSPNICCTSSVHHHHDHHHQHHVNHYPSAHQSPKPALDLCKREKLVSRCYDDYSNNFSDSHAISMCSAPSTARLCQAIGGGTTFEKI